MLHLTKNVGLFSLFFFSSLLITNSIDYLFGFRPCILFFDSMASSSHFRVAATLRDYLKIEYQVKRSNTSVINGSGTGHSCGSHHKLFSKEVMLSACPSVPQQNNSYDCGVFVLQYAEAFMKVS